MTVEGPVQDPLNPNPFARVLQRAEREHRLLSVHWELTYRCNERCSHCYLEVEPPRAAVPNELTTDECKRVLDELADMQVLNLTFSGGEIFVRRDFFEVAGYARAKRFVLRLFTNGIAITPIVADRIAELHPYSVEISLYSTKPELHERITGRPRSFESSTRAMRLLNARGVRTVMKAVLMHETARELPTLRSLAGELGAQF